jgi:dTMP kinase
MKKREDERGFLVCFEGGDAAGKTTLAFSVADMLHTSGLEPVVIDKKSAEFNELFLSERMRDLRKVLWDYPQNAPLWEWGDRHWFHLIVSWFSVLDRCRIQPLLCEGKLVIVDNWFYKFAARFLLKPDFERHLVLGSFGHLTVPDLVVFVDVDPCVAVRRREKFSATESGKMDGSSKGDAEDFISYQNRVLGQLRQFADSTWVRFDASEASFEALTTEVCELVSRASSPSEIYSGEIPSLSRRCLLKPGVAGNYGKSRGRSRSGSNFSQLNLFHDSKRGDES